MLKKSSKIIAIIDVETTGTNPNQDQIIEFAVQKGLESDSYNKSWRVKPAIPIPQSSTEIHGITNQDVADCPPFSSLVPVIRKIFDGSNIIIGYNVSFDIAMIQAEFTRLHEPELDLSSKLIIDPLQIWRKHEPRSLEAAVKRFAGTTHEGAHAAAADVAATGLVLTGMLKEFKMENMDWEELEEFCDPTRKNWIGSSNHFLWQNGQPVVGFGKNKGVSIIDIAKNNPGFLNWIQEKDFPQHVKEICKVATTKKEGDFLKWLEKTYS